MPRSPSVRCAAAVLAVGCALAAGCLSGQSGYLPDLRTAGDVDPHTRRIVLRPEQGTAPARGTQVFIATVYDDEGQPRRNRRVEWTLDGPGSIVEVGQGGYLPGRGAKGDTKFAYSDTDSSERRVKRGPDDFTVGPGQTWCLVTSAVDGETTVTARCPAIRDPETGRAAAKVTWMDGDLRFPPPAATRAGGEYTLSTTVTAPPDRTAGYRVRYRIVDGPAAALTTGGGDVSSVTEAVAPIGGDGAAAVRITQPLPAPGTNHIAVEVEKPDPGRRGEFTLVSKGQTRVTWEVPHLDVTVSAPKALGVNQEVTATYAVSGKAAGVMTLTARVPDEMVVVRTEPKAAVDGPSLIWTLRGLPDGKSQSVTAFLRPVRLGSVELAAEARTADGLTGRGSVAATIAQPKLLLKLDGPAAGIAGEPLPFRVTVTNAGDWAAEKIRVQGRFDDGLTLAGTGTALDETIPALAAGRSKTIPLPLTTRHGGKFKIEVSAAGDANLAAAPQVATVEIKEAQLSVTLYGPSRGYVGQDVTWQVVVRNTGDVPLKDVVAKLSLPPEMAFVRATDGGKVSGRQVVWNLGTAPAWQERPVTVIATCTRSAARAVAAAAVTAAPPAERGRPPGTDRPVEAAIAIVGLPALQLSIKDSADPVPVGERVTYTVRVKNAGTQAARAVEVVALLPSQARATRGTGPSAAARIDHDPPSGNDRVAFPALDSLAPGAEATFVVEAEAAIVGDARCQVEVRSASQKEALSAVEPTRIVPAQNRPFDR